MKFDPAFHCRRIGESMAAWCNRLRIERGSHEGEWIADQNDNLKLRPFREPQSKLDL